MKKRKIADSAVNEATGSFADGRVNVDVAKSVLTGTEVVDHNGEHTPLTLDEIKAAIKGLCPIVPSIPTGGLNEKDCDAVKEWAMKLQAIIEEFNLILCCVATATYKWGTDRSGAADQNVSLLSNELMNTQDLITTYVSPRISNVVAPGIDIMESRCIKTKDPVTGNEIKVKEYTREVIDPAYVDLCRTVLCRNAKMIRHVLLTSFHKVDRVITDYQKTSLKDSEQDRHLSY